MKKPKVLLVDDETTFLHNVSRLLRIRGYHVRTADSGARALQMLAADPADVVIIDLKMPEMDGMATIRKIRKHKQRPQVIVLTGHPSMITQLQASQLDVSDYISKPCRIQTLTSRIQKALSRSDACGNDSGMER